jgi:hypothetical protein
VLRARTRMQAHGRADGAMAATVSHAPRQPGSQRERACVYSERIAGAGARRTVAGQSRAGAEQGGRLSQAARGCKAHWCSSQAGDAAADAAARGAHPAPSTAGCGVSGRLLPEWDMRWRRVSMRHPVDWPVVWTASHCPRQARWNLRLRTQRELVGRLARD